MKKFSILLLSLVLVGCGSKSVGSNTAEISLHITKSPTNTEQITVKADNSSSLKDIMNKAGISFETEMRGSTEFVNKLAGVIATAGKSWKLYINGQLNNFTTLSEIKITQPVSIEWRYEENK